MAGFRRPGPVGFEDLAPLEPGLPPSARNTSGHPLGLEPTAVPLTASGQTATEWSSFQLGGERYRVHEPGRGAVERDETELTVEEARKVLDQVSGIPELAALVQPLRQVVAGTGPRLLRLRPPAFGAITPPLPQPAAAASAPAPKKEPKSWIEIEVVDGEGKPREGCSYRLDLPDGRTMQGKLGSKGVISVHGIDPGSATLTLIEST